MSEFGALQNCLAVMELSNIELKQQNAEMRAALELAKPFTELALRAALIRQLKQQNAALVKALERAEQTVRNLAANLDGDLAQIARNEASNLRDDIDRVGDA